MLAKFFKRFMELGVSGCYQVFERKAKRRWMRICYKRILFNPWISTVVPEELWRTRLKPAYALPWLRRGRQVPAVAEAMADTQDDKRAKSIDTDFLGKIIKSEEFNLYLPHKFKDNNWILQQADLAAVNCFDILGSGTKCFEKIPWHQDFKCRDFKSTSHNKSWQHSFYQDITASCPQNMKLDEYNPDIKVPWELSRFQHIFVLGRAYQINQNNRYASAFQNQISDWMEQNPYMVGVNWVCPMDVAIRAINWIWGFYFFKDAPNISNEFWIKFINMLHMHLHYLEFNWETSDKPNNHYVSDLVGYLYLCKFFKLKKSKPWCVKKILEQFFHQIQPDGTCYEGTTGYHKFDTELFLHFKLICNATQDITSDYQTTQDKTEQAGLPAEFLNRFYKMIEFLQACTDLSGTDSSDYFVTVGDNDSGKILTGIEVPSIKKSRAASEQPVIFNYPDFGLVTIKTCSCKPCLREECLHVKRLHATLRLPKFKQNQPSGHFHYDQLAVTLSINGTPILIDPGSYVYTANSTWRNLMRSHQSHNTFYSPELTTMQGELFQLKLTPQDIPIIIDQNSDTTTRNIIHVTACNKFDSCGNKTAYRTVEIDEEKNFKLTDWWKTTQENTKNRINSEWNLIFNPELKLKKENDKSWSVEKNNKPICRIFSTLNFVMLTGFCSKSYGTLQTCTKLTATKILSNEKQTILIKSSV
ncbi:MAG: heparinase II/III family protein [bacterium]